MKPKLHMESEIEKAVQELESGVKAETVARNRGISKAILYNWKNKYGDGSQLDSIPVGT